jgi:hypothetical protein
MAHMQSSSVRKDGYTGPDHFWFERHHPALIAAWAIGLLALVIALTVLGTRIWAGEQARFSASEASATPATIR